MKRYRITIDRDALDKTRAADDPKHQVRPIRVYDTVKGDTVASERRVTFPWGCELVYGDPQQDGARVWIEADAYVGSA